MSSVLLGVIDDTLFDHNIVASFTDNRIGGQPIFSPLIDVSTLDLTCKCCSVDYSFILQIYCPVDDTLFDRIFYLFVCANNACKNNEIFCFRTLSPPPSSCMQTETSTKADKLFDDEWGDDENVWEVEKKPEAIENDLLKKLSSNDVSSNLSSTNDRTFRQIFQQRFISVFEEPRKEVRTTNQGLEDDLTKFVTDSEMKTQTSVGEEYEKSYSIAFENNKTNYQFYKRIARFPSQLIRYDWSGDLLPYNESCLKYSPKQCENCESPRTFELQLMPALVSVLSQLKTDNFCLEFETVYIFSCSKNCLSNDQNKYFYPEQAILCSDDHTKDNFSVFENA